MADSLDGWLKDQIRAEWEKRASQLGRVNVAIFGKTGVGKSTLVNTVFGEELAATGTGRPVTQASHLYERVHGPLGLLDTRGIEIGSGSTQILDDLSKLVAQRRRAPIADQIHVAWYCVLADSGRFELAEETFVRNLADLGLPVCLVLTQTPRRDGVLSPSATALANAINALDLPIVDRQVFTTMAQPNDFSGFAAHGLPELVGATFRAVPQGVQEALVAAQKVDLDRKRRQGEHAISAASAAAGAAALSPIPLSDAAIIVPIQLSMIARLSMLYGITLEKTTVIALAATAGATATGRSIVGNLAKVVPGYGSVAGGAINASVASAITYAMGQAWLKICTLVITDQLDMETLRNPTSVRRLFLTEYKAQMPKTPRNTGRK